MAGKSFHSATCLLTLLASTALCTNAFSQTKPSANESTAGGSVVDALTGGKVSLALRYRFEYVDADNVSKSATASTIRTTLGYKTGTYRGFDAFIQMEDVTDIGLGNRYNNKGFDGFNNGVTGRPVIADPNGTDLLQAYVHYKNKGSNVKLGVQEIIFDDARFVGNVGWRQHHQTYDALRYTNTDIENLTINYAFISSVNRIFRQRVDAAHHLLNAQYKLKGIGTLTGYGYILKYRAPSFKNASTDTFGIELKGSRKMNEKTSITYEAEFAHQLDESRNANNVDANYFHFSLGGTYEKYGVQIGWERLEGSAADGQFQTPLATLHAMNGWADMFLSTPTNGLDDLYIKVHGPLGKKAKWTLAYHDFSSASGGGGDYGTEFDGVVTYKSSWKQVFGLKGAIYNSDGFKTDTTKVWFFTAFKF